MSYNPENYRSLAIIPAHGLLKDNTTGQEQDLFQEKYWELQDFQLGKNEPQELYAGHIKAGLAYAASHEDAMLVFSGGWTREGQSKWSEAASYRAGARLLIAEMDQAVDNLKDRMYEEDYAGDTLGNLIHSVQRYHQITGRRPGRIIEFGFEFKRHRAEHHASTIGLTVLAQDEFRQMEDTISQTGLVLGPAEAVFTYVGVNNPADMQGALKGEASGSGEEAIRRKLDADPWMQAEEWKAKRQARNPHHKPYPYGNHPYTYPGAFAQAA